MPPYVPDKKPPESLALSAGEVRHQGHLEKTGPEMAVLGFYAIDGVDAAIKGSAFDVDEEVRTIIRHIRDKDPKVSLAALRHFRSVVKEVVQANGIIGSFQQTQIVPGEEGSMRRVMTTRSILSRMQDTNERDEGRPDQRHDYYPALGTAPGGADPEGGGPDHNGEVGVGHPDGPGDP